MKILMPVDGSVHSKAALVASRTALIGQEPEIRLLNEPTAVRLQGHNPGDAIAAPPRRWRHALRAAGWALPALTLAGLTLFNLT